MTNSAATAAVNRFGLGAMPGELAQAGNARGWLQAQLRVKPELTAFTDLPDSLEIIQRQTEYRQQRRRARNEAGKGPDKAADVAMVQEMRTNPAGNDTERTPLQQALRRDAMADLALRYRIAATTTTPFVERLVHFWSNHFAISIDKNSARLLAAPMEREAIRPHVLGHFSELLAAVETHPGMLLYLDNAASVGDDSMLAQRAERRDAKRKLGLNENLAREILELHTLGVDGGYAQQDVIELAKAITGWGTPLRRDMQKVGGSAFVFRPGAHEPGTRSVLGKRYAEGGEAQGRAILRDLAVHPATARHLSLKLARHFVSDTPSAALVERMATAFLRSDGSLPALYRAMIDDDAAWSADARKFKTPEDFVVSAMRAGGMQIDRRPLILMRLLQQLGQPTFTPRSPAGFPDTAADWASGDALRKRVQAAGVLAEQLATTRKPVELAADVLGAEAVQGPFAELLRRAGSPQEGFAVLFSSPAFQWRV
ncbi:MAG: DUF1800 domain-containing protein [Xanthomonadales bacterium]|nr:DUF1800 domain-containing protein [Xanthomonadales bacterium]